MMTSIQWATLKLDPTEPKTNNPGWAPQHMATVILDDGSETRVFFNPGALSQLRKGDKVMLEFSKGKWRMSKTQTPELMRELQQRTSPASPAPNTANPLAPKSKLWTDEEKRSIAALIEQRADLMLFCLKTARTKLVDSSSPWWLEKPSNEDIRCLAQHLFESLNR